MDESSSASSADKIPRYAMLAGIGRVRVLHYDGKGYFTVLDKRDEQRFVHRDRLTFLPEKGKSSGS